MDTAILIKAWEPWPTQTKQYFYKMVVDDRGYHVMWTDMASVWSERLSGDGISERTEELNPGIEVPVHTLIAHLKKSTTPSGNKCTLSENTMGEMVVELNVEISGFPFVWKFNCTQEPQKQLYDSIILPLMTMTAELQRQQQSLVAIVKKKDTEIEDYKMQGFKTTRKHIETKTFDEKEFTESMLKSKAFDKTVQKSAEAAFSSSHQTLYEKIMERRLALTAGDSNMDDGATFSLADGGETLSPVKQKPSPQKPVDTSLTEEQEQERRQALAKRLADDKQRKDEKAKKKRKKAIF